MRVDAQLLSDPVQFTTTFANERSFVDYVFQVGDDVIGFGEGDLEIGIVVEETHTGESPPNVTRPERVLLENNAIATSFIDIRDVFDSLSFNDGFSTDGETLYRQIVDSYAAAEEFLPSRLHVLAGLTGIEIVEDPCESNTGGFPP